jgi:hypothetical protein
LLSYTVYVFGQCTHATECVRADLDHLNRDIQTPGSFQIIVVEWAQPLKEIMVKVINNTNRTYFGCPGWVRLSDRYEMDHERKFILYLDNEFHTTYFQYTHPQNSSSCDSEELPPRAIGDATCLSEISNSTST